VEHLRYGDLEVSIGATSGEAGEAAAAEFAEAARAAIAERGDIAVLLATGNSQFAFVDALTRRDDVAWDRITVLHMDEYLGMSEDHPASFRRWMRERIVEPLHPRRFEGIRGDSVPVEAEIARYEALLREVAPAICVMGIGENGHLAFNDPPADFTPDEWARVVDLDEASRRQQVGEGHFPSLDETPRQAISLTIPALLAPQRVLVVTPEARKAPAVKATLEDPISPAIPASVLRTQPQAHLYLDADSASLLDREHREGGGLVAHGDTG
jgi:glucosamine-6-phosphate deaminase